MNWRTFFKEKPLFKYTVLVLRAARNKYSLITRMKLLGDFFGDYRTFKTLSANPHFTLKTADLYPRIYDKTGVTPLDPVYFYQDAWCAKKIFEAKPLSHTDVGSHAPTIGIISQFVPTTMVDIRPLPVTIPGLSFTKGLLEELPFESNSISSLSSICVIEHIGLGRYGDPLDPFGSEKAAAELSRVLAKNGALYISVPIDDMSRVYFNAHRSFTRDHLLSLFANLTLTEEKYIYGATMTDHYDPAKKFGTGLFAFTKK